MRQEELLRIMSKNAKISTEDMAAMLEASEEEIQETIAKMEEEGIICGYPTLINWDCTDNEMVTALIEVNVALHRETGFDKVSEKDRKYVFFGFKDKRGVSFERLQEQFSCFLGMREAKKSNVGRWDKKNKLWDVL